MPSTMNAADCSSRLTRFPAVRNCERSIWKMMMMTIRPPTTGSTPLWPLRTRLNHAVTYSLTPASGGTAISSGSSVTWSAAVSSTIAGGAVTWPTCCLSVGVNSAPRRCAVDAVLALAQHSGRHDLHSALSVIFRRGSAGDEPAEVEYRHAVGDRKHVVQVVRDHEHRDPAGGEPPPENRWFGVGETPTPRPPRAASRLISSSTIAVCDTPSAAVGSSMITS